MVFNIFRNNLINLLDKLAQYQNSLPLNTQIQSGTILRKNFLETKQYLKIENRKKNKRQKYKCHEKIITVPSLDKIL